MVEVPSLEKKIHFNFVVNFKKICEYIKTLFYIKRKQPINCLPFNFYYFFVMEPSILKTRLL